MENKVIGRKPTYLNIKYEGKSHQWTGKAINDFLRMRDEKGVSALIVKMDDGFFNNGQKTDYYSGLNRQIKEKHPDIKLEKKPPEWGMAGRTSRFIPGEEWVIMFKDQDGQTTFDDIPPEEVLPVDTTLDELLPVDGETGAEEKTYYDILMEHMDHELALMTDLLATHYCLMNKLIGRIS